MHALKEGFRDIFETKYSQAEGLLKLLDWIHDAILIFPKNICTIQTYLEKNLVTLIREQQVAL